MGTLRGLIFGVATFAILAGASATAQDTPGPAFKLIIGADGTGKRIVIDQKKDKPAAPKANDLAAEIQRLLKDLHQLEAAKKQKDEVKKPETKGFELELKIEGGRIIALQPRKPAPAGTIDQKLDRILQEMKELRRDLDHLKHKLDSKPSDKPAGLRFKFEIHKDSKTQVPSGTDKHLNAALEYLLREQHGKEPDVKPKRPVHSQAIPAEHVERMFHRVLQEIEELRRDLRATKRN